MRVYDKNVNVHRLTGDTKLKIQTKLPEYNSRYHTFEIPITDKENKDIQVQF